MMNPNIDSLLKGHDKGWMEAEQLLFIEKLLACNITRLHVQWTKNNGSIKLSGYSYYEEGNESDFLDQLSKIISMPTTFARIVNGISMYYGPYNAHIDIFRLER